MLLCLVGSSFEDESVFGLFWIEGLANAKGIYLTLYLYIYKPKKNGLNPDFNLAGFNRLTIAIMKILDLNIQIKYSNFEIFTKASVS